MPETRPMPAIPRQYPSTEPIPTLLNCAWCGIRLTAIPDRPQDFEGFYYHPTGCITAARTRAFYGVPADAWQAP